MKRKLISYEVGNMCSIGDILDCELSVKRPLIVSEDQFIVWGNVNEMWANIQGWLEQVRDSDILFIAAVLLAATVRSH